MARVAVACSTHLNNHPCSAKFERSMVMFGDAQEAACRHLCPVSDECTRSFPASANGRLGGSVRKWKFAERKLSSREKDRQLFHDFTHYLRRGSTSETGSPRPPVQAPDLIGQDRTGNGTAGREGNLEGVALDPGCDGAAKRQGGFLVVALRTEDKGGPAPCLFMSSLGRKGEPDNVPPGRDIPTPYHASLPRAGPASASG